MEFSRLLFIFLLMLVGCGKKISSGAGEFKWTDNNPPELGAQPFAMDSKPILIKGARIMTAAGPTLENASIYFSDGVIRGISESDIPVGPETKVIDGKGMTVTPGLIDVHSHLGVLAMPVLTETAEVNEWNRPFSGDVWAEHGFYPQDPMLWRALGGGITTIQVLHGSANLIGGRSFVAKLVPKVAARDMRFFGARQGVKLACGENPKGDPDQNYGVTRMGNMSGWRKTFQEAIDYKREWDKYQPSDAKAKMPKRDLQLETLVKVLSGEIIVHWHCYRADDISNILDVAREFGFKIRTIHHGLEAYKVRHRLAKEDVATATWADWWGFKQEAYDGIPQNAALLFDAGAKAIIHSDSEVDVQFLNIEAAKAMIAGRKVGIEVTPEEALQWVTINPAWALGLEDKIGSLEKGKMADLVVWDGHPFSIYSKTKYVFINGQLVFDREQQLRPLSDVEVGTMDSAIFDGRNFAPPPVKADLILPDLTPDKKTEVSEYIITNLQVFNGEKFLETSQSLKISEQQASLISTLDVEKSELPKIDGTGKYLTPGFIEVTSSLGLIDIGKTTATHDIIADSSKPTPDNFVADSLDLSGPRIPIAREEGVTTAIAKPSGRLIAGFGAAFDLAPDKPNLKRRAYLYSDLTKASASLDEDRSDSRSMMWRQMRSIVDDTIHPSPYGNGNSSPFMLTRNDLRAMKPAVDGSVPWVMRAYRASQISAMMNFAKSSAPNAKPILSGANEAWKVADQLAQEKIPVLVKPEDQYPHSWGALNSRFDLAAYLYDKKVPVIITTDDSSVSGPNRLRQQAGFAVKYGMPHLAALQSITSVPGRIFKLDNKGTLAGKDWVLWSGDPLEPTSVAEQVWIGGQPHELDTRQKKLARKYLQDSH